MRLGLGQVVKSKGKGLENKGWGTRSTEPDQCPSPDLVGNNNAVRWWGNSHSIDESAVRTATVNNVT